MRARTIALALALCAAHAAPASAAELATYQDEEDGGYLTLDVDYTADAGEVNRVTATYDAATRTFTLTDAGVTLIRPPVASTVNLLGLYTECRYQGNRVTCTVTEDNVRLDMQLADGADSADLKSGHFTFAADGGAGDDALTHAGTGAADLHGGDGADTLTKTGRGSASLSGGAGADLLRAGDGGGGLRGGPGPDRFEGGAGLDTVDYDGFPDPASNPSPDGTTGVRVSFDGVADDGMPGEGDDVADSVEIVVGSWYADVLVGDERAQQLEGGPRDDVIDGGGGDDVLAGDWGRDHLTGGPGVDWVHGGTGYGDDDPPGDDVIDVADGTFDRYSCGAGTDLVRADAQDAWASQGARPTPAECETVTVLP